MAFGEGPVCKDCGQVHQRCDAHKKRTGKTEPCMRWPEKGGTVCRICGGGAPQVKAAAARRMFEATTAKNVAAILDRYEDELGDDWVDPSEALMTVVKRCALMVRMYGDLVKTLQAQSADMFDLVKDEDGNVSRDWHSIEHQGLVIPGAQGGMALHPYELAHMKWTGELRTSAKVALDAGIEERQVRIAEEAGAALVSRLRDFVTGLDLSPEQLVRAESGIAVMLQRLAEE